MGTLTTRQLELLQLVHAHPGVTRTHAATRLGASTGTTTGLVRELVASGLVEERPAGPTGARGRPTRLLVAHRDGPLVVAAVVDHESWRLDVVEIGGGTVAVESASHDGRDGHAVLEALRAAAAAMAARFPGRVRGMAVALPGVVQGTVLLEAPLLGWHDVDFGEVWPPAPRRDRPAGPTVGDDVLLVGNDATCAAVAEARRGAARDAGLHLHLHLDAGLGGALTLHGAVLGGARGVAGEFGHMPFADPTVSCPCGAQGCWTTAVGVGALATALGERLPADAVTYGRGVLGRAETGDIGASKAVAQLATSLGRGIAALVNGFDVDVITLGGLAPRAADIARDELASAYEDGLMRFRRDAPPPVVPGALGEAAARAGAAEQVWSRLWERL